MNETRLIDLDPLVRESLATLSPASETQTILTLGTEIKKDLFPISEPPAKLAICFHKLQDVHLFSCPFELIAQGNRHYVQAGQAQITRLFAGAARSGTVSLVDLPIRILIIVASPNENPHPGEISPQTVLQHTIEAMGPAYGVGNAHPISKVTILDGPNTLRQLQDQNTADGNGGYDIVEIIAHGGRDYEGAKLCFVTAAGNVEHVTGGTIYQYVAGTTRRKPRLFVLNSCKSGSAPARAVGQLSNIAWQLLDNGATAVVAMQEDVPIEGIFQARKAFLRDLMSAKPLNECVASMRDPLGALWYAPILAMQEKSGLEIFSKGASNRLRQLRDHNDEVNKRANAYRLSPADHNLKLLLEQLRMIDDSDTSNLQLLEERENIAQWILQHVEKQL